MSSRHRQFDSPLANGICAFVAHKRALGCRFDAEEKLFVLLDRYLVEKHVTELDQLTPAVLDGFLASRRRSPRSYNVLLAEVRQLFVWLVLHEYIEVSPLHAEPKRTGTQRRPFLFDKIQARTLLDAAGRLPDTSRVPLRGATYEMIFALLYALGLRVGEVTRLRCSDIDFEHKMLTIRQTKFSKTRLVPFGPRVEARLQRFLHECERRWGRLETDHAVFSFSKDRHRPIYPNTVSWTFHKLVAELGLQVPPGVAAPRLHCLRHSFAVATLLRWYREGIDPAARLLYLSTFLGHVSPQSTAVYLTITDELLQAANKRYERFAAPVFAGIGP